jgi:hypothetical protein
MMVANTESKRAHNRLYPSSIPDLKQVVTVPGPIKAAAMSMPGPLFLNIAVNYQ